MDANQLTQDPEIQNLIMQEQIEKNIQRVVDVCWDKCIDYADSSLSRKQESCLSNCTERFFDTSFLLTQHLNQKIQSSSGGSQSSW